MHAYLQLVRDRFDCYGTWLPGTKVEVGEIGRLLGGGSFSHTGTLEGRREAPDPPTMTVNEPPQEAMTGATAVRRGGGSVKAGEVLQALGKASASVTMRMAKQNSAALILEHVTRDQFRDERVIKQMMRELLAQGRIELDEVVVTHVLQAKSGIVAASSAQETQVGASAGADLGVTEFKIAKVKGNLEIASGKTTDTISYATRGRPLTPMYRALFFRGSREWPRFWRRLVSIDQLIEAAHSLRGQRVPVPPAAASMFAQSYGPASTARPWGQMSHYLRQTPHTPVALPDTVVASSRPSLALAEQALHELSDPLLGATALPDDWPELEQLGSPLSGNIFFDALETRQSGIQLGEILQQQGDVDEAHQVVARAEQAAQRLEQRRSGAKRRRASK